MEEQDYFFSKTVKLNQNINKNHFNSLIIYKKLTTFKKNCQCHPQLALNFTIHINNKNKNNKQSQNLQFKITSKKKEILN